MQNGQTPATTPGTSRRDSLRYIFPNSSGFLYSTISLLNCLMERFSQKYNSLDK